MREQRANEGKVTMKKQESRDSLQNKFWEAKERKINNFKYLRNIKRIMV